MRTAAMFKSEGSVSEAIGDWADIFRVEVPSDALVQCAGGLSDHA